MMSQNVIVTITKSEGGGDCRKRRSFRALPNYSSSQKKKNFHRGKGVSQTSKTILFFATFIVSKLITLSIVQRPPNSIEGGFPQTVYLFIKLSSFMIGIVNTCYICGQFVQKLNSIMIMLTIIRWRALLVLQHYLQIAQSTADVILFDAWRELHFCISRFTSCTPPLSELGYVHKSF